MRITSLLLSVAMAAGFMAADLKAQAPVVTASAASLSFTWQQGAKLPPTQGVSVRISAGTPAYVVTTPAPDAWLIATPASGSLPSSLTVQVNPSTLAPGAYNSTVTITAAGGAAPVSIPVTLTVTASSSGPAVAPATIALTSPGTLTGTFTVTAGPLPATFTATSGTAWLSVSTTAAALLPAQSQTVTVTATPGSLTPQTAAYAGKITVVTNSNGVLKTQTIAVNLTVNPLAPAASSAWPQQITVGSPDTVITIRGANYYSATTVAATGLATPLKTTIVSSDVLLTTIPAPSLAVAGVITLTVSNPAPGGAAAPLAITVGNVSTISAVTNAASYVSGAVSPGEIVAIFGQNIGPSIPAQLTVAVGFAQTNVGGVTVTIDGQAAPILYASSSQVSVQIPYNARLGTVALGTGRSLVLTNGAATPANTVLDIVADAPGLFTLNASGAGAALILNFDPVTSAYTINSSTNPARAGNTIVCFLTGEGDFASAVYPVETGFMVPLTPPVLTGVYPQLSPLPTVTIGGVAAATVSYAGPIPGGMMGLLQINAVVPAGTATGNAVPLSIAIAGTPTQPGVTIAVK
ncbi:MAG TPA: hypothetical protein VNH18_34140 [Bryobacteraceae bacterium]|nr:hypothetical protein [Bryobacteraceae bacterium]